MLKRLYVDNYKSLVNFELNFGALNLFLGENGSGKSTVFEVLRKLQSLLVEKHSIDDLFKGKDVTRWQTLNVQTFELKLEINERVYDYRLLIEIDTQRKLQRVQIEQLFVDKQPLLNFESGEAQLYRDDGSIGPKYPFDWSLSAVASLPARRDNTLLTAFKEQLAQIFIIHPIAAMINEQSQNEEKHPTLHLENFVAWYRHLSLDSGFTTHLTSELQEVLPDFYGLKLDEVGKEERLLVANFRDNEKNRTSFSFSELSEGQRILIALYTLLYLPDHPNYEKYKIILCLDEPENFIALREIQPWIATIYDRCIAGELQVTFISHHPEIMNYFLSPGTSLHAYWFERRNLRASRITPIITSDEQQQGLSVSELIARGWFPDGGR